MIDVGNRYYACDECPLSEGGAYRLRVAQEARATPQFEYCGCDKVQEAFFVGGYCEDAYVSKPHRKKTGKRKTGAQYRRAMAVKHRDKRLWVIKNRGYNPIIGYVDWELQDGVFVLAGNHIKYPKNSNDKQY